MPLPHYQPSGDAPAHEQIERWLTRAVDTGRLGPGDRLPAERELAQRLGVSRMTLRRALDTLERQGRVRRVIGRSGGTFVEAPPRVECDLTTVVGFTETVRRAGLAAGARVVSAGRVRAPRPVAVALGLGHGQSAVSVVRVRSAGGDPVALEHSWFPAALLPGLLQHPLDGSLYALLDTSYDRRPTRADEGLEPVVAEPHEAALLDVAPGSPLMRVERTAYDGGGTPVEFARDLFRGDRARFVLRSSIGG